MATLKKVAYQGMPGAYSQIAAQKYFKRKLKTCPQNTFEELFQAVKNRSCHFGMVPIENSIAGSVYQNYDLLDKYNLAVVGEIYLKISHNLLVIPLTGINKRQRLKMIKKVYSHPQALWQCQKFFKDYLWMKAIPAQDTAGSARQLKIWQKKDTAAIASSQAAKIYSLEILKKGIETDKNNFTRFVVIGSKQNNKKVNKVSLIFSVAHRPGSLYQALKPFAQKNINLTKIESRPIVGKPWEYLFYLDFEDDLIQEKFKELIGKFKKNCLWLKILGFYQKGETVQA